jgi:prepilin-type N-terminal cleavage/methylation domain-containing protein
VGEVLLVKRNFSILSNIKRESYRRGFSLIEILLVAILISILIVLFIPNFRKTYQRLRLEFFAQRVMSFCRTAQNYALTKGKRIMMVIPSEGDKLIIEFSPKEVKELKIPKEYEMETDIWHAIFDGFGAILFINPTEEGVRTNGYLKLIDKHGREVEIDLYLSGNIVFKKEVY